MTNPNTSGLTCRKPGRPKANTQRFHLTVDQEVFNAINDIAVKLDLSKQQVVNLLLKKSLKMSEINGVSTNVINDVINKLTKIDSESVNSSVVMLP